MENARKYPQGFIYKLYTHIDETFYIGSTFSPMRIRLRHHRHRPPTRKVEEWFNDTGFEEIKYIIIGTHLHLTKRELKIKEDEEIRKHLHKDDNCLNCRRAYLTDEERKQYFEDYKMNHKKEMKEYHHNRYIDKRYVIVLKNRNWQQNNKEHTKEYQRQHYQKNKEKKQQQYEARREQVEARNKVPVVCDNCGSTVTKCSLTRHKKSKKCTNH